MARRPVGPLGNRPQSTHLAGAGDPHRIQTLCGLVDRCAGQRRVQQEITRQIPLINAGIDVEPHRRRLHQRLSQLPFSIGLDEMAEKTQRREQPSRSLTLIIEDFTRGKIGLDDRTSELRPRLGVRRGRRIAANGQQPRRMTSPSRPAKRKELIGQTGAVQLVGTSRCQRVQQRAADRWRIFNQASELRGGLRIHVGQRGVENLDFQAKPGPGPFEQLRQGSGQHRFLRVGKLWRSRPQ